MKKTVFGCLGAAAIAFALQFTPANVQAGLFSSCTPCDEVACFPCDDSAFCDPCDAACGPRVRAGKWFLEGHFEAGFFANSHGQKSVYDGSAVPTWRSWNPNSGNTVLLQNARLTGAQVNQAYIALGRQVDGRRGLDLGGRMDFTWGSDAYLVQAEGIERTAADEFGWGSGDYYAAVAQAYAELAYGQWNFKAGKFYTPFGSNHFASTERFFYTLDQNSIFLPHVAGGAYATYTVNRNLAVFTGWMMPDELGRGTHNNNVLGGFAWEKGRLGLKYAFATGRNSYNDPAADVFLHSLVVTDQITQRLKFVFDWSYLDVNLVGGGGGSIYGLNHELTYQFTNKFALGGRFGVLNASNGTVAIGEETPSNLVVGLGPAAAGSEWYTVSIGANWTPNDWLLVKPEVRYDWVKADGSAAPFRVTNGAPTVGQFSGGMSAIMKF